MNICKPNDYESENSGLLHGIFAAHCLSTVRNADQIVVIDRGRIVEKGDHAALIAKKGAYYELVKNQLELGN